MVSLIFKLICLPCRIMCNKRHGMEEVATNRDIYTNQAFHNDLSLELT